MRKYTRYDGSYGYFHEKTQESLRHKYHTIAVSLKVLDIKPSNATQSIERRFMSFRPFQPSSLH
jgi:hypothetical protein